MTDLLTGLLVIIAGFYAWATYRILKANEGVVTAMREYLLAANRPYVTVTIFLRAANPIFYLSIKNIGKSPARDLLLKIDKDFWRFGERRNDKNIKSLNAFSKSIESLPPNAELQIALALGAQVFGAGSDPNVTPPVFTIEARYSGVGKQQYTEHTTVDLHAYLATDIPQDSLVSEAQGIRRAVEALVYKEP